jgi:hypothetical protein
MNALPTMANLSRRCIVTDGSCGFCSHAEEDVLHAVWSCPSLHLLWGQHELARKIFRRNHGSILDVLSHIFDCGPETSMAELVMMLWLFGQEGIKLCIKAYMIRLTPSIP